MTDIMGRYQEFEVAGDKLVPRVRQLIDDGNARRLFIKRQTGETILEIPLTAGVAIAAAGAVVWPVLAAVGALAGLFARVTIGVERVADDVPV